ncbi:MAG: FGGY-family carbohydrate kinase [Saccharofermentanales bacterium]
MDDKTDAWVMAVDVGTQTVRAIVFDRDGAHVAEASKKSAPYYSLEPGWAEVPADQFWDDTCEVMREVVRQLGPDIEHVAALAITANRDNIIPLDDRDRPLRDWITWVDTRRAPEAVDALNRDLHGADKLVFLAQHAFFSMIAERTRFNWLKFHEPDHYAKTRRYASLTGYLTLKLCGVFRDARGMQVGYLPYQAKRQDWYRIPAVYKIMGVRRDQLPELVAPGELIGRITREGHEATGLPIGLPLIASAGDKQCETLGSGVFGPKQATISYGTMATIATTIDRYIADKKLKFYTFASCLPDHWSPEYSIYRGYWLITWFWERYAVEDGFPEFIERMNDEAAKVPPGSNGLFVFPFWTIQPGLYPNGKGLIAGWMDCHVEADLYRALLESIAYALREGLELMEQKSGVRVEELNVVGGGSRSDVSMQLTADIFKRPARRLANPEICALGAAINAAVWAGIFPSYEDGVKAMVKEDRIFYPNPNNTAVYDAIYQEIYKTIYRQNEELFIKLDRFVHGVNRKNYPS